MTMFPSGGFVSPTWRPGQTALGSSDKEVVIPASIGSSALENDKPDNIIDLLKKRAEDGDSASMDYLISYLLSEQSLSSAREWTAKREDTAYQRMVADLKRSGINPYFALNGGSPISSSTQGINYQSSSYTSSMNNQRTTSTSSKNNQRNNWFDLVGDILHLFGTMASSAMNLAGAGVKALS